MKPSKDRNNITSKSKVFSKDIIIKQTLCLIFSLPVDLVTWHDVKLEHQRNVTHCAECDGRHQLRPHQPLGARGLGQDLGDVAENEVPRNAIVVFINKKP